MKILWLCNMIPGAIRAHLGGTADGGLWVDHVLADLRQQPGIRLHILCPGGSSGGTLDESVSYQQFTEGLPYIYLPELETAFAHELEAFRPDVIHIWGTEFGHTLAMVNAARAQGMESRIAVSIQGLCSVISRHYSDGLPGSVIHGNTFRDWLRRDNIAQQQEKFALRGDLERKALEQVEHVIGRTAWDRDCTAAIRQDRQYHFCNETLRQPFYSGCWEYASCTPHRIFASSYLYPLKGFHYLLEAMPAILAKYPDARICITGPNLFTQDIKSRIRRDSYTRYLRSLCRKYRLEDRMEFVGMLGAEQMKREFLKANVFVLPSTIENSPNSLGEAMLLGVPSVAANVGGVADLMSEGEGYIYEPGRVDLLAERIQKVFSMEAAAEELGAAAAAHARITHDPEKNLSDLLRIYETIATR